MTTHQKPDTMGGMCVACREFVKEKLTLREFKAALWEISLEDPAHIDEVERILHEQRNRLDRLREELRKMTF